MIQNQREIFDLFNRENNVNDEDVGTIEDFFVNNPLYRHLEFIPRRVISKGAAPPNSETSTDSPSPEPSLTPSEFPNEVAAVMTMVPSASPTISNDRLQPTVDCSIDANGDMNVSSAANKDFVDYKYKIVTQTNGADLTSEILPILEEKLLEKILPSIFQCSTNTRSLTDATSHTSRRLALLGASSNPPDMVSDSCPADSQESECNMIDGKMTFYFSGDDVDLNAIKVLTCDALNDGTLLREHPAIVGLECISGSNPGLDGNGSNKNPPAFSQSVATPAAVLSALAAIFVVFGVYAYRRKKNPEEAVPEKANLDDSDINNSNSISFDDVPMAWSTQTKPGVPAFDLHSIIPKGYSPETIEELPEEDSLDEVSLDQLNMNVNDSDLSS